MTDTEARSSRPFFCFWLLAAPGGLGFGDGSLLCRLLLRRFQTESADCLFEVIGLVRVRFPEICDERQPDHYGEQSTLVGGLKNREQDILIPLLIALAFLGSIVSLHNLLDRIVELAQMDESDQQQPDLFRRQRSREIHGNAVQHFQASGACTFGACAFKLLLFPPFGLLRFMLGPPRPSSAQKWIESVSSNPRFRFTAKVFHSFTHERQPAPNDEKEFKEGIAPIAEAGRLGALLLQFPWSFKFSPENRQYVVGLRKSFSEFPLVVEVRHTSWLDEELLDLLSELGVGICNIDQPLFHRSVKPAADVTSGIGYVRLHGRNYRNWFSAKADVRDRYDHLYSPDELDPWITERSRLRKMRMKPM